jgi:hypothetical protein
MSFFLNRDPYSERFRKEREPEGEDYSLTTLTWSGGKSSAASHYILTLQGGLTIREGSGAAVRKNTLTRKSEIPKPGPTGLNILYVTAFLTLRR